MNDNEHVWHISSHTRPPAHLRENYHEDGVAPSIPNTCKYELSEVVCYMLEILLSIVSVLVSVRSLLVSVSEERGQCDTGVMVGHRFPSCTLRPNRFK